MGVHDKPFWWWLCPAQGSFLLWDGSRGGATGRHEGRKCPHSCQISSCSRRRTSFSFSKEKSNGASATGSSSGLCNCDKKGWARASSTLILLRGWISSIFLIRSNASTGVLGNCVVKGTGSLDGSLRMKRFAFSDVTKSRSGSESFPSFSQIIVNCSEKGLLVFRRPEVQTETSTNRHVPDQCNHHLGNMACAGLAQRKCIQHSINQWVSSIRDMRA